VTLATDRLDVVAIGNAVVDVIARVGDPFLAEHGVDKGVMTLIDRDRAEALYAAMPPAREISGGSAANTAAGIAALGCKTGFLGRVRDDQLGRIFMHDIRATGVRYDGPVVSDGPETSRCLVLVSPDGERSMSTYLGASTGLVADDIDTDVLRRADWLYLEGYLFDTPEAKAAYAGAIRAAKPGGGRISITLSDPFCVDRHREDFRRLIRNEVDLLFANRAELLSLCEATDLETALDIVSDEVEVAAVTLSEKGSVIVRGRERTWVEASATDVVDATGAGDSYAAGFLAGLVRGKDDRTCAEMGSALASEVIGHVGARPEVFHGAAAAGG